jgi:hypothetical protein
MTDNFVTFRNNKSCRQKFGIGMGLLQIIFYVYKRIQTRENRNSNKKQRDQALFLIPKCHLLWSTYFQCIVKIGLKVAMLYFFHPEPVCKYLKQDLYVLRICDKIYSKSNLLLLLIFLELLRSHPGFWWGPCCSMFSFVDRCSLLSIYGFLLLFWYLQILIKHTNLAVTCSYPF